MKNLTPFNLQAAKAGAKVTMEDGGPTRIICWDAEVRVGDTVFPIVALIGVGGEQRVGFYDEQGNCINGVFSSRMVMAPVPGKKWRVIFRYGAEAAHRDFNYSNYEGARTFWSQQKIEGAIPPFEVEVLE